MTSGRLLSCSRRSEMACVDHCPQAADETRLSRARLFRHESTMKYISLFLIRIVRLRGLWIVLEEQTQMRRKQMVVRTNFVTSHPPPFLLPPLSFGIMVYFHPTTTYSKTDYIETDTGNKVSRRATIAGPQNIILGGKTIIANGAIIRGDLRRTGAGHAVVISIGRYCLIGEGCIIRLALSTRPRMSSD
jgi:hypothetical protein